MRHEDAFRLVSEHAPRQAGMLWNTSYHTGCDTANAVADQYGDDEEQEAIADLMILADDRIPDGWEPHDIGEEVLDDVVSVRHSGK